MGINLDVVWLKGVFRVYTDPLSIPIKKQILLIIFTNKISDKWILSSCLISQKKKSYSFSC